MMNYTWNFSQSETEKYCEWIIIFLGSVLVTRFKALEAVAFSPFFFHCWIPCFPMFNTRKLYSLALQVFNTWRVPWEGALCLLYPVRVFCIVSHASPRGRGGALGHETKTAARKITHCTGWAQDSIAKVCFASWLVQRGRCNLKWMA